MYWNQWHSLVNTRSLICKISIFCIISLSYVTWSVLLAHSFFISQLKYILLENVSKASTSLLITSTLSRYRFVLCWVVKTCPLCLRSFRFSKDLGGVGVVGVSHMIILPVDLLLLLGLMSSIGESSTEVQKCRPKGWSWPKVWSWPRLQGGGWLRSTLMVDISVP